MHEYAVTKSFIDIAINEAKKANARKITKIVLVIGDLSSIIDDSVKLYFDMIAEGTIAKGAELVFKRVKAQLKCLKCDYVFVKENSGINCPKCNELSAPTEVGKEFYIESIDVE